MPGRSTPRRDLPRLVTSAGLRPAVYSRMDLQLHDQAYYRHTATPNFGDRRPMAVRR